MKIILALMSVSMLIVAMRTCDDKHKPVNAPPVSKAKINKPAAQGVLVISGIFDPAGEKLLQLKPVRYYSWHSGPVPNQPQGRFMAKVTYVNGEVTKLPFDALVADDAGRTRHGFFELVVPVSGAIDSISVTDASGEKLFALIKA
ncbi:MAG: hypothetical protein M3Y84_03635, partial [Acidobacteriota bacterium]|nr:hypothetical protein [Acidobacteriota bacterium]